MSDSDFDPISYINEPRWNHSSLGLERIEALLKRLDNPEKDLKFIHVAGTNGKGSTCSYLSNIFFCAGYKCGLFTSPYIDTFEERIRVDGQNIDIEDLRKATLVVRDAACAVETELGQHPTEFELMCAVALVHFKSVACDIVVMEVGLGGRLDSTNVITPEICVITRIGLDHCAILGDTIEEIAAEKAGIIKKGVEVVSSPQDERALGVIRDRCRELGCNLHIVDDSNISDVSLDLSDGIRRFRYMDSDFETHLLGSYQIQNATTAICAAMLMAKKWNIDIDTIKAGIRITKWVGRFEILGSNPLIIVDGAHNPDGAAVLKNSLMDLSLSLGRNLAGNIIFVVGVLSDKDYSDIVSPFVSSASMFVTYTPDNPRALCSNELTECIKMSIDKQCGNSSIELHSLNTASEAIEYAYEKASPESVIVAFGTLYSISEIKQAVHHLNKNK